MGALENKTLANRFIDEVPSPNGLRPTTRWWHVSALAFLMGLLVAACSSSAATSGPVASVAGATAVTAATPAPTKGPATQSLTLTGPAGAAGAVTGAAIRCDFPSTDGSMITVIGQPTDPNLSVYVDVLPGEITVRYDSGSGSTYVERDFAGTGVTSFDAGKGAQIDSQLAEVPNSDAHGSLGVLTAISGKIDCGNQMPGSSTLMLSGPTPKGTLNGGLDPVNVECVTNTYGKSVSVIGIAQVGTTPTLVVISISPGTLSVSASGDGFYRNTATAMATLTATGAHVDGDLVEQNLAAGSTAHTIHMSGDATCGATIGG